MRSDTDVSPAFEIFWLLDCQTCRVISRQKFCIMLVSDLPDIQTELTLAMQEDDIPIHQPSVGTTPELFESQNKSEMRVVIQRSKTRLGSDDNKYNKSVQMVIIRLGAYFSAMT